MRRGWEFTGTIIHLYGSSLCTPGFLLMLELVVPTHQPETWAGLPASLCPCSVTLPRARNPSASLGSLICRSSVL